MRERGIHRILTIDLTLVVLLVVGERPTLAIVNPTTQRRFGETAVTQILISHLLKLGIAVRGVTGPVNMKTKDEDCHERKQPTPHAQASIRCGGAQPITNSFRKVSRSGERRG